MAHNCTFWDIDSGVDDPEKFFRLLPSLFPAATTLFIEGTSISPNVLLCYERHKQEGPYLPARQTIFPSSKRIRCATSRLLWEELAQLGAEHAVPELLDHLCLYQDSRCILFWHDAFMNAILLDETVPEAAVADLASAFQVPYRRLKS